MISIQQQLKILISAYPDRSYSDKSSPESIGSDYRKLIVCPKLRPLIDRGNCAIGDGSAYEDNCLELVKELLDNDFSGSIPTHNVRNLLSGKSQIKIRDITIGVPNKNLGNHWDTIIHDHCKRNNNHNLCIRSIIFECKNYSFRKKITSKQVYQLFEYLNPTTYGKLGIILCRFGEKQLSKDAKTVMRRLILDDYRILVLGDDDILEWIDIYEKTGSSETFFAKCIDRTNAYLL